MRGKTRDTSGYSTEADGRQTYSQVLQCPCYGAQYVDSAAQYFVSRLTWKVIIHGPTFLKEVRNSDAINIDVLHWPPLLLKLTPHILKSS